MLAAMIGGCSGSTSGGIKIVRVFMLMKQGSRELSRLIHPNGQFNLKLNDKPVSEKVMDAVWGFIGIYILCFIFFMLLLAAIGMDFTTAFFSTAASLSNIGPSLGETAANFHDISDAAKYILSLAMLIGRLELFTVIVLLAPAFWKS